MKPAEVSSIVESICYWVVAASIAELASSMPSTATVYRWALVTGGDRHGRLASWYAGWWSFAAWQLAAAALVSFMALQATGIYAALHPGFELRNWQLFCAYVACDWTVCLIVLYGDKFLSLVVSWGIFFTLSGWLV